MKIGNLIRTILKITGIHYIVKYSFKLFGKDCGCDKRAEALNEIKFTRWSN